MARRFGVAIVAVLISLAACSAREVTDFAWSDPQGTKLGFSRPGSSEGAEGRLESGVRAARFLLSRSFTIKGEGGLALDLALPEPVKLTLVLLGGDGKPTLDYELGAPDRSMRLVFPLGELQKLRGVEIEIQPFEGEKSVTATIRGIAFVPAFHGFSKGPSGTTLSPGFSLLRSGDKLMARLDKPFAGVIAGKGQVSALRLGWRPDSAKGTIELIVPGMRQHSIAIRPGSDGILLPQDWFGHGAATPSVEFLAPPGLDLVECDARAFAGDEAEALDLGVVLNLPRPDPAVPFEVYRWDALPKVLVFDFADYAAQDAALKRLAFFVEKAGFRGRLAPDAEIAPLHGWNAHDYRASDLAAFFAKAKETSFQLGQSELAIRDILLATGIIRASGQGYAAGEGAMISISRESPSWLRATFMAHEASHAIYFTDPDFNAFVRKEWAGIDKDERWFWKLYFGWMNYDTADQDLMATEFMAYLYQQPVSRVEEYFTKILPPRVLENHPDLKPRIDAWMERYSGTFVAHAQAIEDWLKERYGFVAARPWSLY